jgi:hypothetical protein
LHNDGASETADEFAPPLKQGVSMAGRRRPLIDVSTHLAKIAGMNGDIPAAPRSRPDWCGQNASPST